MKGEATNLDRLYDIVVPSSAPWWPPAPGWYWIIGLLIIGAVWLTLWALLRWQRNRYRREALKLFATLEKQLSDPSKRVAVVTSFAILLKRAALSAWPRETVAALTGLRWLKFLDRTGRTDRFSQGPGLLLADVAYDLRGVKDLSDQETRQLAVLVRKWLAHHQTRSS
jgi:hypothetical protein